MLALPGSLLWLFLLVYFSCGQILDTTTLDTTNSSNKGLDNKVDATNQTSSHNNEKEKENKTAELSKQAENAKPHPPYTGQLKLLSNNASSQVHFEARQDANRTTSDTQNKGRNIPNRNRERSRVTQPPMMSQERRNSYLSIAERRKYYNRTREPTKKSHLNDVELEHPETGSKLVASSTEPLLVNMVRAVKKPVNSGTLEVIIGKNQTNNQRAYANSPSNDTQGKLQITRQSVIQSQFQFGQKLNLRKPVSRTQDALEEKSKKKKERSKMESLMENSTNKLNKNYPTQSTKLIRVDKNLWATTTIPQADADNENSVTHTRGNATVLEKLVGYITTNNRQTGIFSSKEATASDYRETGAASNNQTKVPRTNSLNPLPLNNLNVTAESSWRSNASVDKENVSVSIQDVYNQEILKLNNSNPSKTATGKQNLVENSNFLNISHAVNKTEMHSSRDNFPTSFNNSATSETASLFNTTDNKNVTFSNPKSRKFPNLGEIQPTTLKSNLKGAAPKGYPAVIPVVKAISKESSNLTPRSRISQSEANSLPKQVSAAEAQEKNKSGSATSAGAENEAKNKEYPLTIELNENNKRVLSEMFQTLTTSKPKQVVQGKATTSQAKLHDESKNKSAVIDSGTTAKASGEESTTPVFKIDTTTTTTTESSQEMPPNDHHDEDHKAQGTRYNTKFYISPKFNGSRIIKVVEEEEEEENVDDVGTHGRSASVAIYVLAAFGLIPLLLALIFGAKFMIQRNQREYECESDAKSDVSANESQIKESKKKKGSTDLKKSPSNVTTITLVAATRLPRVQHWENSEKQGNRNWEFPRSNLKLKTILGQGNFGQVSAWIYKKDAKETSALKIISRKVAPKRKVWKADAEDMPGHEGVTRLVAVKTVKEGATEKEHIEFIKELEIMQQIGSHPNIVTLLGCCTDQEPYYLIMEYVKNGKLLTYLREHRVNENYYNFSNNADALTSRDLTVFAYCVARGMEYLASRGIIHRDLAARNVLVDHNKLCKIADFGMSRCVRDFENGQVYEERQQKGALPIRWMAPESLIYSVFTYKSDVWSFGILMWEIVTLGSTPYPNMGAREVMKKVRDGYRLERPSHCKPEFYRLISYCWAHDPNKRPDFSELRHELSNLLDNPTKDGSYVDLDRFAVDNSFHVASKANDFRLAERSEFKTLQKLRDWEKKDWPQDMRKIRTKRGRNNGKGTVTLTGQGSFTVNSRILEKEFKII